VGAIYKVEAKPSDPALGFGAKAEPFTNPVLTSPNNTEHHGTINITPNP
jgi:hypothetical protein